ncbi:MAG: hypothetical protein NT093_03860 [Candidatus Moranbacteria bacterium]|nr:hypothetical protein [Candidatus Moranbacteria bacterium]
MTLKKGILWSQKKMRPQKVRVAGNLNPIMQKVLSNKKIAKALDQPRERKEFFGMIKNLSKDGVYKGELRKLFGDLRSGKLRSRTINAKEIRTIAKEFFPDSAKRYTFKESKSQKNTPTPSQNSAMFDEIRRGFSSSGGAQTESSPPQNVVAFRHEKVKTAKQYPPPGNSLDYEFAKPGFIGKTKPSPSDSTIVKKDISSLREGKSKTAKQYPPPGNSLDYEFAKPGFIEETKANPSGSTTENSSTAPPEVTKTKPAVNHSPLDDRLKYEYEKSGNISPNTPAKMAAVMNIVRKKILAAKEDKGPGKKGSFSQAMAATTKNKRS